MSWVEGEKLIGDAVEDSSVSYGIQSERKLFDLGLVKQGIQATLSQLIDKGFPFYLNLYFRLLIYINDCIMFIPKLLYYIYERCIARRSSFGEYSQGEDAIWFRCEEGSIQIGLHRFRPGS